MNPFRAIVEKELRETLWQRASLWTQVVPLVAVASLFAGGPPVALALVAGAGKELTVAAAPWFTVGGSVFVALFWVMANGVDAIAGERERHTIETLVASPARRGAIVFGKIMALVVVAVAFSVAMVAASGLLLVAFYGIDDAGAAILLLLLGPVLAALAATGLGSLAFLISYRAKTVKSAASTLGLVVFPFFIAMPVVTSFLDPDRISDVGVVLFVGAALAFVLIPGLLMLFAYLLFRRDRVISV